MDRGVRDHGAGAVEYLAVLLLVSAIVSALSVSGVGADVVDACATAVCRVAGGDCARDSTSRATPGSPSASPAPETSPPPSGKSPPRPPIPKRTCAADPDAAWTEGLHAHNDYQNTHPLDDSLARGVTSVEADVWLDDSGELQVHHLSRDASRGTLRDVYIKPLIARAAQNGGQIYKGRDEQFQLLIEIKQGGAAAYEKVLEDIKDLPPGVNVIFDAGRPDDVVGKQPANVSFDISPAQGCTLPPNVDPADPHYDREYARNFTMLNASYSGCVDRDGDGKISESEQRELNAIVQRAHDAGLKFRIVEGPDGPKRATEPGEFKACSSWIPWRPDCKEDERKAFWRAQMEAGVDFLDTAHITQGQKWLLSCGQKN